MAERTTDFPDGPEIRAFRAVEDILREDPGLLAGNVRILSWNGDQMDSQPISPQFGGPVLRISPEVTRNDTGTTQMQATAHLSIKVEIFVAGFIAEDIVNFWGVVRNAMVRSKQFRDTSVQCYLTRQCGSTRSQVTTPGYGSWQTNNPPAEGLAGVGRIEILMLVPA
jgi:hypothetical protein